MKRPALLLLLASALGALHADDVLFTRNGERRAGRITGYDGRSIRMEVALPPPPGAPAGAPAVFALVTVPREDIDRVEFSRDPALEALLGTTNPGAAIELAARWDAARVWLNVPRSPAGRIGLALGEALLRSGREADAARALELFTAIEKETWDPADEKLAKQGRLRAKVAIGRAAEAIGEATQLAAESEDPTVLMEAKFILAEADAAALRKLVEENPRWEEDDFVRPEHARLRHAALDLYLFPYLFHGSEAEAAARGLWGAVQVHAFTGSRAEALECARDLVSLYPNTRFAALATDYIHSLPEDLRAVDPEKEAREAHATPAPQEKASKKPKSKKNEKKPKS